MSTAPRREPLLRVVSRPEKSPRQVLLLRLESVLLSLAAGGIFILLIGYNPFEIYATILSGAFRSKMAVQATVKYAVPLVIASLGVTLAFRMRFWNIGAEGQIIMGAVFASYFALFHAGWNHWLLIAVMLLAGALGGGLWGLIPALCKVRWNTNETLFTLMMNYVATAIVACTVNILRGQASSLGKLNKGTKAGWFPRIFGQYFTINIIVVVLLMVLMYVYLKYSKQGYEISVVGDSENTARYAGINVKKVTIRTMAISGAICGLAGFIAVAGASHTISTSTAGGRGFTAIIVAWLAQFNTFVMILISFLLVFLQKGAIQIASQFNLNDYASNIITGIILFFILGSEFFINYRIILRGGKEGAK